ncbi:hypothetical protein BDQ12DRAFT_326583 [Crucibulum laeve]|uniref:TPR-like protein n=1 Tax=Crucibulum laeve TaxID=68775 RepID=A0A5C3LSI5_9AGAR|nr:hypothetical protein BDQ12DRAFT_326583 [Crucibulum laeve]
MEIIGIAKDIKDAVALYHEIKGSLEAVKRGKNDILNLSHRILVPIYQLQDMCTRLSAEEYEEAQLCCSIKSLNRELEAALNECKRINIPSWSSFSRYFGGSDVEKALLRVQVQIAQCTDLFTLMTSVGNAEKLIRQRQRLSSHGDKLDEIIRKLNNQNLNAIPEKPPKVTSAKPYTSKPTPKKKSSTLNLSSEELMDGATFPTNVPKPHATDTAETNHPTKEKYYTGATNPGLDGISTQLPKPNRSVPDAVASLLRALDYVKTGQPASLDSLCGASLELAWSKTHRRRALDSQTTAEEILADITRLSNMLQSKPFEAGEMAMNLGQLSVKLSDIGDYNGACDVGRKSVKLLHDAGAGNRPNEAYSIALHNLSTHLSSIGSNDDALRVAQEAVAGFTHLRALDGGKTATEANLAMSLNTLSYCLNSDGLAGEALDASQKSVGIYSSLDRGKPGAFQADLAMSLVNFANRLRRCGRFSEAQKISDQARRIYAKLYNAAPNSYASEYAASLSACSKCLQCLNHYQQAMELIQESIGTWRRLEKTYPSVYTSDLADALVDFYAIYTATGLHREATAAMKEAITLFRRLAEVYPEKFKPELALSLASSARSSIHQRYYHEGLNILQESLSIFSTLHARGKNSADYATALDDVSTCQRKLNDARSASVSAQKAVHIRRSILSQKSNSKGTLGLAESLSGLAACREALNLRDTGSMNTLSELRDLYESLYNEHKSNDTLVNLAVTQYNLSQLQSQLDYHQHASLSAQEAVKHFEHLVLVQPDKAHSYYTTLVEVLINMSYIYTKLSSHQDALKTSKRAVDVAKITQEKERRSMLAKAWKRVSYCYLNVGQHREAQEAEQKEKLYAQPDISMNTFEQRRSTTVPMNPYIVT